MSCHKAQYHGPAVTWLTIRRNSGKNMMGPIHCHPHSHLLHIPRFKEPGSMRSSYETSVEGENMCSRKHGHMYVCQAPVGRVMRGAGVGVVPILLYYHNLGRECEISKYTLNLWLRLTFLSNDHGGGGEIKLFDNHTCVTSNCLKLIYSFQTKEIVPCFLSFLSTESCCSPVWLFSHMISMNG